MWTYFDALIRSCLKNTATYCITILLSIFLISDAAYAQEPLGSWPLVYVSVPRDTNFDGEITDGDSFTLNEVTFALRWKAELQSDLILRKPVLDANGNPVLDSEGKITYTDEVLVSGFDSATGKRGAIWDPMVSFDGEWVYYTRVYSVEKEDFTFNYYVYPLSGSDIFKIHLKTRKIVQLTNQKSTPLSSTDDWSIGETVTPRKQLGRAVFNMGASPLPGGKIIYATNQNAYLPGNDFPHLNFQLAVTDDVDDSKDANQNAEVIGHLNLGSALHPHVLSNGEVLFSSAESQALRDGRMWALWSIWPDGRLWKPRMSAFGTDRAFHFHGELSDGRPMVIEYYNQNNNGFGTLVTLPSGEPEGVPPFGDPDDRHESNPKFQIDYGNHKINYSFAFTPQGNFNVGYTNIFTRFANSFDIPSALDANGNMMGKVSYPAGGPNNSVVLTWSGPLRAQGSRSTYYDGQICYADASRGKFVSSPSEFLCMQNLIAAHEIFPRPLLPYEKIYGKKEPSKLSWVPNKGEDFVELPYSTPFGEVGSSSLIHRNTAPRPIRMIDPLLIAKWGAVDPFFSGTENWAANGADAGKYTDDDIFAVRILGQLPSGQHNGSFNRQFFNYGNERFLILGEIPVRKFDANGNPVTYDKDPHTVDTSFLARIPADLSFTFQTIDRHGAVLNMSQTWHQVRPGERRADCGGCHAHAKVGVPFDGSAASKTDYKIWDLTTKTPLLTKENQSDSNSPTVVKWLDKPAVTVEYNADIKPILNAKCISCHSVNGPQEGGLVLDDETVISGYEASYNTLCKTKDAGLGTRMNASHYVRAMQARRSLLYWKIRGERTDGFSNEDFLTDADNRGYPAGASRHAYDIDLLGTIMPPPGSGVPPLTEDEKMTLTRWIDLGCPVTLRDRDSNLHPLGWDLDTQRPTLTLTSPRAGSNLKPLKYIAVGLYDLDKLDLSTFRVTADIPVNGRAPGANLVENFDETKLIENDYRW
ncbi:MAG: hypothetical protein J5J00_00155, partial [Deltaproteobacteria bacterium]|nr:hypothetical protein [Deltaproteobacteria bacterium]